MFEIAPGLSTKVGVFISRNIVITKEEEKDEDIYPSNINSVNNVQNISSKEYKTISQRSTKDSGRNVITTQKKLDTPANAVIVSYH